MSRRTVARDLDFLRDEERAPLAYDDARHGFRLTDETYTLPPVRISRKEAFSFGLARKLLAHYEGTPLHLDMRSVLEWGPGNGCPSRRNPAEARRPLRVRTSQPPGSEMTESERTKGRVASAAR